MKRYRTGYSNNGVSPSTEYFRYTWIEDPTLEDGGRWSFSQWDARDYTAAPQLCWERWDSPVHAVPRMQDMIENLVSVNPAYRWRIVEDGTPNSGIYLNTEYLFHTLMADEGGNPAFRSAFGGAQGLYAFLGSPVFRQMERPADPTDPGFSIWFLIRDMVEMPKLVKSILKSNKDLKKFRDAGGGNLTGRSAASSYLAYKFGVVPTIADIKEFLDTMLGWHGPVKMPSPITGIYTARQSKEILPATDLGVREYYTSCSGIRIPVKGTWRSSPVVVTQTVKYYYLAPELSTAYNRVCQFIDKLGILDPAAVWDVIPFSFVLDWFADFSGWIQSNWKPDLYPVHLVLVDSCEAAHRTLTCELTASYKGSTQSDVDPYKMREDVFLGNITVKQVARRCKLPDHIEVVSPALKPGLGLRMGRAAIGAALITQLTPHSRGKVGGWSKRKSNLLFAQLMANGIPPRK